MLRDVAAGNRTAAVWWKRDQRYTLHTSPNHCLLLFTGCEITLVWSHAIRRVPKSDHLSNSANEHHYFQRACKLGVYLGMHSFNKTMVLSWALTLKVLNFWKFTSSCSLKPLWSGMGEVVPARTSLTLHPPSPPTVHQLSWLALWELILICWRRRSFELRLSFVERRH